MPNHPLAEVFGFPINNLSLLASRYRTNKLCPFGNRVPKCTKDKVSSPLGVCSIFDGDQVVITCPIRFRQEWIIAEDAAAFFFAPGTVWTPLTEVRLKDAAGRSAGNIDIVLVSHDIHGNVLDFGALEVQSVYISGNDREPFEYYMADPSSRVHMDWRGHQGYPRPDYLSSSRKRLAPQLMFKGGILSAWNKRMAVALNRGFYETLPALEEVDASKADIAWFVYDLKHDKTQNRYVLNRYKTMYTQFESSLNQITRPDIGEEGDFLNTLESKLREKLKIGQSSGS